MLTRDINSVTLFIYLMMFIQIFKAGIEDEFALENTSKEETKMGEHHSFSSLAFPLSQSPRKINKDLLKSNHHDTLGQDSYHFTNKAEII